MFEKNFICYELTKRLPALTELDSLQSQLLSFKKQPLSEQSFSNIGFECPIHSALLCEAPDLKDNLVFVAGHTLRFKVVKEQRKFPAGFIDREVKKIADEIRQDEGYISKKELQGIKDEVILNNLKNTPSETSAVELIVDISSCLIFAICSSFNKAEEALALLRKAIGTLPLSYMNMFGKGNEITKLFIARLDQFDANKTDSPWLVDDLLLFGDKYSIEYQDGEKLKGNNADLTGDKFIRAIRGSGANIENVSLGITLDDKRIWFTITNKGQIKGIEWPVDYLFPDMDLEESLMMAEASSQMLYVGGMTAIMNNLIKVFAPHENKITDAKVIHLAKVAKVPNFNAIFALAEHAEISSPAALASELNLTLSEGKQLFDLIKAEREYRAADHQRMLDEKSEDDEQKCISFDDLKDENDPLYSDAVSFITTERRASVSMLQRKFKVGYNRAYRLLERAVHEGVVSDELDNGTRQVLVPAETKAD